MLFITSYINFAACLLGLFLLTALLFIPSRSLLANRILALLLLSVSLQLLWTALHDAEAFVQWPNLMGWGPALLFSVGPLLYLYFIALTNPEFRWKKRYFLHFLPLLLIMLDFSSFYWNAYEEKQRIVLEHYVDHQHSAAADLLPGLHLMLYLVPARLRIFALGRRNGSKPTPVQAQLFRWLNRLFLYFMLAFALFVLLYWLSDLHLAGSIYMLVQSAFIFIIGYQGLRQPGVFGTLQASPVLAVSDESVNKEAVNNQQEEEKIKYEKSHLPEHLLAHYEELLCALMECEKPYLNPELSLKGLGEKLALSPHHLSQLLNQRMGLSFYDYIHQYRLEEVKRLLLDPGKAHLTVLALAFEAGFKSKTVFNQTFKQHTGMTPSAYKKQYGRPINTEKCQGIEQDMNDTPVINGSLHPRLQPDSCKEW